MFPPVAKPMIAKISGHLLYARTCSKYSAHIISFNPHNNALKYPPHFTDEKTDRMRLRNLAKTRNC